jgi:hypothetical protein
VSRRAAAPTVSLSSGTSLSTAREGTFRGPRPGLSILRRETEQLWGLTEQDLPAAIKAAGTRRVLQNPKHVLARRITP